MFLVLLLLTMMVFLELHEILTIPLGVVGTPKSSYQG